MPQPDAAADFAASIMAARAVTETWQRRFGPLWLTWNEAELGAALYGYQAAVAEHEQQRAAKAVATFIDVSEVDTLNVCGIGSGPGADTVSMLMPRPELTRDQALTTAAYLVLMAETSEDGLHHERFLAILDKIANT